MKVDLNPVLLGCSDILLTINLYDSFTTLHLF
jgi:hypothetical protein